MFSVPSRMSLLINVHFDELSYLAFKFDVYKLLLMYKVFSIESRTCNDFIRMTDCYTLFVYLSLKR